MLKTSVSTLHLSLNVLQTVYETYFVWNKTKENHEQDRILDMGGTENCQNQNISLNAPWIASQSNPAHSQYNYITNNTQCQM